MKINDGDIDVAVASWVPLDRQFFSLFHFYKWAEGGTSENTARMQMLWPSLMTDPIKRSAPQRLTLNEMSSVVSLRRLLQFSEKKSMRSMQMIRTKDENEKGAEMADATASFYIWPKFWVQVNAWACTVAAVPIQRRHQICSASRNRSVQRPQSPSKFLKLVISFKLMRDLILIVFKSDVKMVNVKIFN